MPLSDIPQSWIGKIQDEVTFTKAARQAKAEAEAADEDGAIRKTQMKNLWPAFVSGAGLFSDGYVNNSISTVTTVLSIIYAEEYTNSPAMSNIASIAFAGTVVGQLSFGYISDHYDRKGGMMAANILLIAFTILCAVGTWGANGSAYGLFAALTTFRFFLGIAIGAEYPTSSVIASEFANQLPIGKRNRYFCWFTNFCIDAGFVVSAFVPLVLLWIFSEKHLHAVWRLTLGLGAIPPFALFFMRMKIKDSESFQKYNMKTLTKFPFWLTLKFYWFRLTIVSLIWFIYDFSIYSFGTYSSFMINKIVGDDGLYVSFGWNVVFNLFYIPGAFFGAYLSDFIGPRLTISLGVFLQGIIGFAMSTQYPHLKNSVGRFVVVFGFFITFGEFVGDTIGLLAAKTCATPIRGQYYGIAAAIGKVGAFVGTKVFPIIMANARKHSEDFEMQAPFYVSAALCIFSGFLALFLCPSVGQNAINAEDDRFIAYLKENNFDVSLLGNGTIVHEELEDGSSGYDEKKSKNVVATSEQDSI